MREAGELYERISGTGNGDPTEHFVAQQGLSRPRRTPTDVSSTLSRRMGLAVPSVAEASRGLPSVKAENPPADDQIVTSVAFEPQDRGEPVSPELALVDPVLAERLRPLLPEPVETERELPRSPEVGDLLAPVPVVEGTPNHSAAIGDPLESATVPVAESATEHPPEMGDLLAPAVETAPQTEPPLPLDDDLEPRVESHVEPEAALKPPEATVHVLPVAPLPVESRPPAPELETVVTIAAVAADVRPVAPLPPESTPRSGGSTLRRLLAAFGAGAVIASLVVVGVIAEMGESNGSTPAGGQASPNDASPVLGSPSNGPTASPPATSAPRAAATKPKNASPKPATTQTKKQSAPPPARKQPSKKRASAPAKAKATAPAAPSRRFAWAPVERAVGYRVELFRGDKQVLRATTKQPVFELAGRWRHQGRAERLSPGAYRWYVWPVFKSGPAAQAVVQARLEVP
jgi:hypothetical protein